MTCFLQELTERTEIGCISVSSVASCRKALPLSSSMGFKSTNQTLEATADGALDLPLSTQLLTPSVGGASVSRSRSGIERQWIQ
jgi:hypothetical protein